MDPGALRRLQREAWDSKVRRSDRWTVPVDAATVKRARRGDWRIVLTPQRPVPREWFPDDLIDCRVLCLGGGGGQQAPILAAAGARVTVLDNSPAQLGQDRHVAEREALDLVTVEGDMANLTLFDDRAFDLVFHPCANAFAPEVLPIWNEAYRVLDSPGRLLAGFSNPLRYIFDDERMENGSLEVRHRIPYSDLTDLDERERRAILDRGDPLEFGHTLDDQIGGQLDCGFVIRGFYEDTFCDDADDPISSYIKTFIATYASKD